MSHIVKLDIVVNDLDALKEAAGELGLEFREGQKNYKWFGNWVGGTEMPKGVKKEQLGHCDHALAVKDNKHAYEVGVVANADGTHTLLWDFWNGGYGLQDKIGVGGGLLMQGYTKHKTIHSARRSGLKVERCVQLDGGNLEIVLRD